MKWKFWKPPTTRDEVNRYFMDCKIGVFEKEFTPKNDEKNSGFTFVTQHKGVVAEDLLLKSIHTMDALVYNQKPFSEVARELVERVKHKAIESLMPERVVTESYRNTICSTQYRQTHRLILMYTSTRPLKGPDHQFENLDDPIHHYKPLLEVSSGWSHVNSPTPLVSFEPENICGFDLLGGPVDPKRAQWSEHDPTVKLLQKYEKDLRAFQKDPQLHRSIRIGHKMMRDYQIFGDIGKQ
ncbi:MAG: hypothetical protein ACI8Y7_001055 [Candidatus Woesearchaeota archaeon]|jgi:hypothetical protein